MWVFYLISLPLTMRMVLFMLRYFAGPDVPRYVLFTVGYTWFCSLSIIILVPADIWATIASRTENEDKEDEEKGGSDENDESHEAREEHYKGDDASSAVAHDTQATSTETEPINLTQAGLSVQMNIEQPDNKTTFHSDENNRNENDYDMKDREDAPDDAEDLKNSVGEVWGLDLHSIDISILKDAESYLLSKLLDALRYYHRTLPSTLDHSFDSFKGLLKNPLELTSHLQDSLLSLLVEFIQWCPENEIPIRTPAMLYKYLQPFTTLFMFSPIKKARNLAYRLAVAAMFSTGAFDGNFHKIHSWFLFLPGFQWEQSPVNILEVDVLHNLTLFVITFLCDVVSTIGNSLVKYWNILKNRIHSSEGDKYLSPDVSPFIICVLEKCLKVIRSKSGTCSLPKKSIVLSYTCSTVKYLLQTQVNAELLSSVVNADLTERLGDSYEYDEVFPEWKPLKNLLDFVEGISHQQNCCLLSGKEESVHPDGSLGSSLGVARQEVPEKTKESTDVQCSYKEMHVNITADSFDKVDAAISIVELLISSVTGSSAAGSTPSVSVFGDSTNGLNQNQDPPSHAISLSLSNRVVFQPVATAQIVKEV